MTTVRICPSICSSCNLHSARYRCPRCSTLTCSLPCSRIHKIATNCSGVRDRAAFVAITNFTDRTLLSDFTLLEEIALIRGRSSRDYRLSRSTKPSHNTNRLIQACRQRNTVLRVLAPGMTRRRRNRSVVDISGARILWTVEVVLDGERFLRHRIDEHITLDGVINSVVGDDLTLAHRARRTCSTLLIAPAVCSAPFRLIPPDITLRRALAAFTLIEYPIVHVVRTVDLHQYRYVVITDDDAEPGEISDDAHTI